MADLTGADEGVGDNRRALFDRRGREAKQPELLDIGGHVNRLNRNESETSFASPLEEPVGIVQVGDSSVGIPDVRRKELEKSEGGSFARIDDDRRDNVGQSVRGRERVPQLRDFELAIRHTQTRTL